MLLKAGARMNLTRSAGLYVPTGSVIAWGHGNDSFAEEWDGGSKRNCLPTSFFRSPVVSYRNRASV